MLTRTDRPKAAGRDTVSRRESDSIVPPADDSLAELIAELTAELTADLEQRKCPPTLIASLTRAPDDEPFIAFVRWILDGESW